MAQTPQQKAYWDAIPDNTKLTPEMAMQAGYTQDAQGHWVSPEGHRFWTGELGTKGGVVKQVLKDTAKVAAIGSGIGLAAGLAGGGVAAGAAGAAPAAPAAAASAAAPVAAAAPAAAAAAGGGWASWIPKIATVGAQVIGGINSRNAIKDAQQTQQQATNAALGVEQKAQQTSGDVYNQQRADFQNLAGQPFQTLGGLLGMNIAPVGPMNGRVVSTEQPMGVPQGLNPNVPLETPYPGKPGAPTPEIVPAAAGATLNDIAQWSSRKKSTSSYVRMQAPDGSQENVPANQADIFEKAGARRVG